MEPADGLEVRLYDYDASDQGEALWLGNDGVLVRDDEADRWLVAFDPDTLDWEPRST